MVFLTYGASIEYEQNRWTLQMEPDVTPDFNFPLSPFAAAVNLSATINFPLPAPLTLATL